MMMTLLKSFWMPMPKNPWNKESSISATTERETSSTTKVPAAASSSIYTLAYAFNVESLILIKYVVV